MPVVVLYECRALSLQRQILPFFLEIICIQIFVCVLRMCITRSRDAVATLIAQICCSATRGSRQQVLLERICFLNEGKSSASSTVLIIK